MIFFRRERDGANVQEFIKKNRLYEKIQFILFHEGAQADMHRQCGRFQ